MFQIKPLNTQFFAPLFSTPAHELADRRARMVRADSNPGYPCRVSLVDAEIGEEVLLTHFVHHDTESPFRASHAVYVRQNAPVWEGESGEIPPIILKRDISLRGFDTDGMLMSGQIVAGTDVATALTEMFEEKRIAYIHLHFAILGCYAAQAVRSR